LLKELILCINWVRLSFYWAVRDESLTLLLFFWPTVLELR